jgi:AAA+ ATPase superfamily predicted ATPase
MIQVGKPVTGKNFIGRKKEAFEIIQYLKMGQSVVLIAPRRFGKTSLVLEILRQLKNEKHYTGFVDVFAHSDLNSLNKTITAEVLENSGLKKIYQNAKGSISSMMQNIKLKAAINEFEVIMGLEDSTINDWDNLSSSIDFINDFGEKSNHQIFFAFDEYGDILKYDKSGEIIKLMRAKIQQQKSASYIFSGSYESVMNSLFVDNKSPFYRMARIIKLGYLEENTCIKHMKDTLDSYDISISIDQIEKLVYILKGHPYYCQLAIQQVFLLYKFNKEIPDNEDILNQILQIDRGYLEKTWEDISTNKEYSFVLKHLSNFSHGLYSESAKMKINASRAITYLIGKGIIYKTKSTYDFYDPILKLWIQKKIYS